MIMEYILKYKVKDSQHEEQKQLDNKSELLYFIFRLLEKHEKDILYLLIEPKK